MTIPDSINGCFELLSSFTVWFNIRRILIDKQVKGFSIIPLIFFTIWGFWNLYYYPYLHQTLSFIGGLSMVSANMVYIALTIKYSND